MKTLLKTLPLLLLAGCTTVVAPPDNVRIRPPVVSYPASTDGEIIEHPAETIHTTLNVITHGIDVYERISRYEYGGYYYHHRPYYNRPIRHHYRHNRHHQYRHGSGHYYLRQNEIRNRYCR